MSKKKKRREKKNALYLALMMSFFITSLSIFFSVIFWYIKRQLTTNFIDMMHIQVVLIEIRAQHNQRINRFFLAYVIFFFREIFLFCPFNFSFSISMAASSTILSLGHFFVVCLLFFILLISLNLLMFLLDLDGCCFFLFL